MKKYSLLYISLGLVVIFSLLHFFAIAFYLYWTLWWFDNLMHFFAGFIGGFIIVWLLLDSRIFSKYSLSIFVSLLIVLVSVFVVGVVWEIFEYINDIAKSTESYSLDTFRDIILDILGATFASLIGFKQIFRLPAQAGIKN